MKKHNVQRSKRPTSSDRSTMPWRFFILTVICACIMAAGFFFAARQHFMTMDLGLKNSKMRKQIEDLESERRRLILSKEISLSPLEITRTAQSMGFREHIERPEPTVISDVNTRTERDAAKPIQTSFKQTDKVVEIAAETRGPAKLVKPIVQQTVSKQVPDTVSRSPLIERPRVVNEGVKKTAETPSKHSSKLR